MCSSAVESGVPADDLSVLRGCVSRNRALFSPTPSVDKTSFCEGQMNTGTRPELIASHESQDSTLQPSDDIASSSPNLDYPVGIPYSVSVQFGICHNERSPRSSPVYAPSVCNCDHQQSEKLVSGNQLHPISWSIPSRLNSPSLKPFKVIGHSHSSCSCATLKATKLQHHQNLQFVRTNSLDCQMTSQAILSHNNRGKGDYMGDLASSLGSQHSLFSSTYTFQDSCTYVKGVDGKVFKERMKLDSSAGSGYTLMMGYLCDNIGLILACLPSGSTDVTASASRYITKPSRIPILSPVLFMHTIRKWFSESNDQQRNMMLLNLLDQCSCAQMHLLSLHMEPILHDLCPVNCQDLLSWLPSNLTFCVLSFLDPVSLCRASQVSRTWHHMASDYRLWMNLCRLCTWQISKSGEEKQRKLYISPDGRIMWKAMFSERFRIRRNWLKGFCNVRTFEGHTQGISCIQFDDTRIVSGSWDKTIKVWNRRTNTAWAALTLAGHSGTVRCLHLHDNRLVSGSSDRTIKVWDLSTDNVNWVGATCRITMVGHMHTVRCLQADHEKVISGSYDNTLKVWDLTTGICSLTLSGHDDAVLCLHFHGNKLVSGSKDTTIKVWDLPGGYCQLTLHGHQAAVTCVQFDDTRVISGALDRLIKIWSLESGQCERTIDWIRSEGHTGVIRHLQADGWKIVSAADDKTLKVHSDQASESEVNVWSIETGTRLLTLKSHTDGVTCLQFNDEVIVSGSYDKTVKLWDFSVC